MKLAIRDIAIFTPVAKLIELGGVLECCVNWPARILFACIVLITSELNAAPLKVVFVSPGHEKVTSQHNTTGEFWPNVSAFMRAAANDLNLKLVTFYAERNHILMKSYLNDIIAEQPDYVILVNEKNVVDSLVLGLTQAQIPVFMLLNKLSEHELSQLTKAERSYYIGSVTPNNKDAGYRLLNSLLDSYSKHAQAHDKPLNLLALHGDYTTPASIERAAGLNAVLKSHKNINLIDSTSAEWSKHTAFNKVRGILNKVRVDLIWAANDAMAFGAKQAVEIVKPKNAVLIGGINWDTDDAHYPVDISYGGHVTLGAYALVMVYDMHNKQLPLESFHQQAAIFESSLACHSNTFKQQVRERRFERYDFTQFSYGHAARREFTIANLVATAH